MSDDSSSSLLRSNSSVADVQHQEHQTSNTTPNFESSVERQGQEQQLSGAASASEAGAERQYQQSLLSGTASNLEPSVETMNPSQHSHFDNFDEQSKPLLESSSNRPASKRSHKSHDSHEQTPLLSRSGETSRYDGEEDQYEDRIPSPAATSLRTLQNGRGSSKSTKGSKRWPTYTAIGVLFVLLIVVIGGAFFAPAVVEEYAKESLVIEPTNLSIDSFTPTGVKARVQANFKVNASRVHNPHVRNIGRFGTWIAREVESRESTVEVYLPEYGNILVGTALVPRVVVDIRNGHTTAIDFLTDLQPGDIEGLRQVANDWLEGRLDQIRILGKAHVGLKSGIFPLGSQTIAESLIFEGSDIPAMPEYNLTRLNFHEVPVSTTGRRGMAADVSLSFVNSYPIKLTIPPLGFDILVPSCGVDDPYIRLADAITGVINVEPNSDVTVDVGGIVRELPNRLVQTCPHNDSSPLDLLLGQYIHGRDTTIFVRGSNAPDGDTPEWISKFMSSVTVPVPFPGHTFDKLIKNFTLANAKFNLPSPFPQPGSNEENPRISGDIIVTAGLPKEMNFEINVTKVRAHADVFFKGDKLGVLSLKKWQEANSTRIDPENGEGALLKIESRMQDVPLVITDDDVFTDVLQAYLFGSKLKLKVEGLVDVEVSTVLGKFIIKDMPAEGAIPIKPISPGSGLSNLKPKVGNLRVLSTDRTAINLEARVNFTNPTEYAAHVPYFNIHILNNGSVIGDATARSLNVTRGNNTNVLIQATWNPIGFGGKKATKIGRELLSQYISGFNTTLTFQTHEGSIPNQSGLGKALSKFAIEIPTPRLSTPSTGEGDGGDDGDGDHKPHFIQAATFHVFSSTAQFTLVSPLKYSTIYIENINATALYNHTEPVGTINYDLPFKVPPGISESPRLPVDVDYDSVGYEELRKALGGTLKLDARGTVGVRLGQWTETVWYVGSGIGASVRF